MADSQTFNPRPVKDTDTNSNFVDLQSIIIALTERIKILESK